jgi:subtilisin family serine protease
VINMSYGSPSGSPSEGAAISNAWANGAIIVAAAGNDNRDSTLQYPAGFAQAIAVGSTDNTDDCGGISDFSNVGTWVECYAPGGGVMSTRLR